MIMTVKICYKVIALVILQLGIPCLRPGNSCPMGPPVNEDDTFTRLIITTLSTIKHNFNSEVKDYNIHSVDPLTSSFILNYEVGKGVNKYNLDVSDVSAKGFSNLRLRSGNNNMVFIPEFKTLSFWVVTDELTITGSYRLNYTKLNHDYSTQVSGSGKFSFKIRDLQTLFTIKKDDDPIPVARMLPKETYTVNSNVEDPELDGLYELSADSNNLVEVKKDVLLTKHIFPLLKNSYLPDLVNRLGIYIQSMINTQLHWSEGNAAF